MPEPSKLAEALAKAQGEYQQVDKSRTATVRMKSGGEYQYKYADLSDILKMALPILSKHELALTQLFRRNNGKLLLTTRLTHSSGEVLESDGLAISEGLLPQEFGTYVTYWRRYDACSLLGIAPDDDDDARLAQEKGKKGKVEAKLAEQETELQPILAFQVRAFNSAIQQSGKTPADLADYYKRLKIEGPEQIKKCDFNAAIKWANQRSEDSVFQGTEITKADEDFALSGASKETEVQGVPLHFDKPKKK